VDGSGQNKFVIERRNLCEILTGLDQIQQTYRPMEPQTKSSFKVTLRATCPRCFGPMGTAIPEADDGKHIELILCKGVCQTIFAAWPEHQWSEPESRPIPAEFAVMLDDRNIRVAA
jgi:hypothetical protein